MGIAYVQFKDAAEAERARAARHRATMGTRYIECLAYQPDRCAFLHLIINTGILQSYAVLWKHHHVCGFQKERKQPDMHLQ